MMWESQKQVSVLMVGIGGYGYYYLKTLLEKFPEGKIKISGIVDPEPERSELYPEIRDRNISIFSAIADFYDGGNSADLVVIASPIHYHVPQSIIALQHGSNVLCDKPIGATIQEAGELIRVKNSTGKWVMIGYQWCYSPAIQSLKRDIIRGVFGKPIRLKTLCLWARDDLYYRRNDWAGKIKDENSNWILDSPVNNALAHFLHNLLYILGKETQLSAEAKEVTAELYRANPIENYDTAASRIFTNEGVELLFYGSHCTASDKGPMFNFQFEDATISFGESSDEIVVIDNNGDTKSYGSPDADHQFRKLFDAVECVHNPIPIVCGLEAARSQTLCMNGIQESMPDIVAFPKFMIHRHQEEQRWWVEGLDDALFDCYQNSILPSEENYPWAKPGNTIDLNNYHYFPGGIGGV